MNRNGTDFTVGTYAHIGTPDACAGSDDAVHISFFQIAAWIFPEKMDGEVSGKDLPVVCMAAEIQICACL